MWFWRKKTIPEESVIKESVHDFRRREIEVCWQCGVEIRPGNELMACGIRFNRWTMCMACYKSKSSDCTTIMYKESVWWEVDPGPAIANCKTVSAALEATLNIYHERPCLGFPLGIVTATTDNGGASSSSRGLKYKNVDDSNTATIDYHWLSYGEVLDHAAELGYGLKVIISERTFKLVHQSNELCSTSTQNSTLSTSNSQNNHYPTVLLYAEASVEWYLMQYGCILEQLLIVPVLDGTPEHQLEKMIERCNPDVIITSPIKYKIMVTILSRIKLDSGSNKIPPKVVLISPARDPPFTYNKKSTNETSKESTMSYTESVLHSSDIATMGRRARSENQRLMLPKFEDNADHVDTLRMLIPTSGSTGTPKLIMVTDAMMIQKFTVESFGIRTIMYSFQPIRQSFDTLIKGGGIGLWSGDLGAIHRDMAVLRPTNFGSTPVFWIAQLQHFNAEIRNAMTKTSAKVTPEVEYELRTELINIWREKRLLGNRCKVVLIGGAPSSEELRTWIWEVFVTHVIDGYGTSETGAIAGNTKIIESSNLHLIDVPDMGYLTTDTPYPRGEIVAFTKQLTPGYYNDPVANEKSFIKIGGKRYFRTGDIGMLVEGKLIVIDRKKSLFKLPNGVFVAPAPLETLFGQSPLIKQALVHGTPGGRTVSVVVVLTDVGVQACSREAIQTGEVEIDPKPILKECARLVIEAGRKEYEIPQCAILSLEEWTIQNGCITSSLKPCRPVLLKKFFGESHDSSSANKSLEQNGETPVMLPSACRNNTDESFRLSAGLEKVLKENIPSLASIDSAIPCGDQTLYSLGIDSLAIALLRSALQTRFGVNIPLTQLAGTTLLDLNTAVLGGGAVSLPDIEDGPESLQTEADAVRDSWRIGTIYANKSNDDDACVLRNSPINEIVGNTYTVKKSVLLTGVTGFVGAFLLDELLRIEDDTHVVCLVRAKTGTAAWERVKTTLQQYRLQCNPTRWSVMVGNLAEAKLGISEEEWETLVNSIRGVYHAGAIVNASLPLAAIRSTNITGTKTIVELCVAAKADLHHISTVSVLAGSGVTKETFNVPPPAKYSTAYAKSKWVAEKIVGYGVSELGLCAIIYRLGRMACHSVTGACNPNDTFTRIIEGIIALEAFTDDKDSPLPKGFYLTPIDWAVKAICAMSTKPSVELKNSRYVRQKINVNQPATEAVEVVHILTNEFLSTSTALNAITKYGMPVNNFSTTDFKEKLNAMEETNAMYTFRDIFRGGGGGGGRNPTFHLNNTKTFKLTHQCPEVGEMLILKMLHFLQTRHGTSIMKNNFVINKEK